MDPRDVSRRFFEELWNERALERAEEIVSEDCVTHQLRSGEEGVSSAPRGPAALREHVAAWLAAFPDLRVTVESSVAEADRVASWIVMRGTHRGPWMGVPPTNRSVAIRCVVMHRVENGRIAEDWVLTESLGFFQRLGLVDSREEIFRRAAAKAPAAAASASER